MRHADDNILNTQRTAAFNDLFQGGDQSLAAIQTETLCAHVFNMQEFFKTFGFDQFVQNRLTSFAGKGDFFAKSFDPLFQPCGLFRVRDMHVLQRECATIGAAYDINDLTHGCDLKAQNIIKEDRAIHVCICKPIILWIKRCFCVFGVAHAKGIKIGGQVTTHAIGADQHDGADAVQYGALHRLIGNLDAFFFGFIGNLFTRRFALGRGHGPFAC